MRINRQNKIIVGIIALVLALTVGYAIFTESLNVGGTASASGDFNIIFESIGTIKKEGYTDVTGNNGSNIAIINEGEKKKVLDVVIDKLDYPGAYVEIPVVISNEGSIDAMLESMVVTKADGTKEEGTNVVNLGDVELRYEIKQKEGETIETSKVIRSKEKKDMLIKVTWLDKEEQIEKAIEVSFSLALNYKQYTGELAGGGTGSGEEEPWMFKINGDGVITAYNYYYKDKVKVPAEVDGVPVKTITKESFLPKNNLELYVMDGKTYAIIIEEEPNYTNAKQKIVEMYSTTKSSLYVCKDKNTCYNVQDEEDDGKATKVVIPEGSQLVGSMVINPNPSVGSGESISFTPKASISILDLSEATNLESIGDESFKEAGITNVTFGENSKLQMIGNNAFKNNQISNLNLPSGVTTIGEYTFDNNQISNLNLPTSVTTIGNFAFSGNQISTLNLNNLNNLATIGDNAFSSNQISSLGLPSSVTSIGNSAFFGNQISNLDLSGSTSLTTIGSSAFYGNQISSLIIPKTVTTVGNYAFDYNPLENLSIGKCTMDICRDNSFGKQVTTLTVESGEIGYRAFYSNPEGSNVRNLTLGEGVTSIGDEAFLFGQISSLVIPSTVTTIGNNAFQDNPISSLDLSGATSLTTIGYWAFGNNQIDSLIIPQNVTTIDNYAFSNNQISSLTIPSSITTIGEKAFSENSLSSILIKRTEEDFLANVTTGTNWYGGSPTITYQP